MRLMRKGGATVLVLLAMALPARARAQIIPVAPVTPIQSPPSAAPPSAPAATGARARAPPPAAAAPAPDTDAVLERVLRSGCRDGLPAVHALVGQPAAPWAETVLRLCGDILRRPASEETTTTTFTTEGLAAQREPSSMQEGRGRLVFWSSLYGIWLGIAADVLFDINGSRSVILPPLLGMGAGLGLSLALTADVPISAGQAWTIITGLDYGSFNGALWAGSFDLSSKGVVGTTVAFGLAAASAGVLIADAKNPTPGDIELVRSGLLWGTVGGFLALAAFSPDSGLSQTSALRGTALMMDVGFIAGMGLAANFDLSRNRVLIIDAGALGGTMTGLGIAWLMLSTTSDSGHVLAGSALAGLIGGIAIAAYATRNIDAHDDRDSSFASAVPALLARDPDGRWRPGTPTPVPVWDGTGSRLIGATVNALAGSF